MELSYFATKPKDEIGPDLMTRIEDFYQFTRSSGLFDRVRRSYQAYYGLSDDFFSDKITPAGERGELSAVKVNQYRSILQGLLNLTTSQKASFEVRATNTDSKSQSQAILAQGILEYYLREKNLERILRDAVELSLVMGEGYVKATWEPTSGEQYGVNPETGSVIYEGDIEYETLNPLDVVKDFKRQSAKGQSWLITRSWRNKYDLAAKNPELQDDILAIADKSDTAYSVVGQTTLLSRTEGDEVPYYEFYHRPTEAVPNGRYIIFLDADTILFDGPLPYKEIPVYRVAGSELHGTPFGYTIGFDLLGPQQIYDVLHSTVVTNQSTWGVGNVWTKPGSGLSLNQLQSGMNHFESEEKPEALNLTQTPAEIFGYMDRMERLMETLSGLNSTVRGNPSSELHSGAALALVASQAVQFNSGLQQAWANLLEDVGTASFKILQDFAKVPRVAIIAGKHNRSMMKEFSGDDLEHISRVVVDMGNPVSRTTAGRVEIANQLLQAQKFETPEEYLQVISTGKLEPLTEARQTQLLNIRAENERLRDGQGGVKGILTDKHPLHILEHMSVLDDPDIRQDPAIATAVLNHVQEHLGLWASMPPSLLQLLNIPPCQPGQNVMGMPQPPPPGMPPPQGQPGPQPGGVRPQPMDATNPVVTEAHGVKGPRMPNLPKGAPEGMQDAYQHVKQSTPAAAV